MFMNIGNHKDSLNICVCVCVCVCVLYLEVVKNNNIPTIDQGTIVN